MAYSKGSLVLTEATPDDVPALAAIFPLSYHSTPYFKKMFPDTSANDIWWQDSHRIAMLDPRTRFVKVTDQANEKIVGMARWLLPRTDDGPQPGSEEDRWPEFTNDVDRTLSDPLFEVMGRSRAEYMQNRKHYCR
jgi:hypothetical protein